MYIEEIPNRSSPPAILLRESYREDGKVKKRTLANLSKLPSEIIEALRAILKGGTVISNFEDAFDIVRTLPHGHVAATLATLKRIGLDKIIASKRCVELDLVIAMIVARVVAPASKLATTRGLREETRATSLGELLGLDDVIEDDLYAAMDWLLARQAKIETALAERHLEEGCLVLYDLTSTYFEGRTCPLAKRGYSRDGKAGKLQIVFGLLCEVGGRPVAVEVFEGNTSDAATLSAQIAKIRERFGIKRVVLVGDRGMITDARIREDLRDIDGLDWITALCAPAIRTLAEQGTLDPELFDDVGLAEVTSPDYPDERLMVCRNPFLAGERRRKRIELLDATERELAKIAAATQREKRPLRGADKIGLRVGKVLGRFKVGKHFAIKIIDDGLTFERRQEKIDAEAALDGFYVIRTSVPEETLDAEATVRAYKGLSVVERAFRCLKTVDLKVRPICHRLEGRVRAHVFLCMLAYYVEWHMREALTPVLFHDDDPEAAEAARDNIVAPAQRSRKAKRKASTKRTDDGQPVHSFRTLLDDLGTICRNHVRTNLPGGSQSPTFVKLTTATPPQQRILDLLHVRL